MNSATADPVARAVTALRRGGLVGLPTETVYGLAADAVRPEAVARIYAVKGRPADHPLILHIAEPDDLWRWTRDLQPYVPNLVDQVWPGPVTIVARRSGQVGDFVTGGQDTVAIRVPDHPLALRILREFGGAVAAPSANRFGQVSPTAAAHVRADIGGLLIDGEDVIVDGGPCRVGVESTIVDCTGAAPVVLRPGFVDEAGVAAAAGVAVATGSAGPAPRVSGSLTAHYAPRARVVLAAAATTAQPGDGLLADASVATPTGVVRLLAPTSDVDYAARLYQALREADALALPRIVAVPPDSASGVAAAIRDRLTRAAAGHDTAADTP